MGVFFWCVCWCACVFLLLPTQLLHVRVERDARDRVSVALEVALQRRILLQRERERKGRGILNSAHQQSLFEAFVCFVEDSATDRVGHGGCWVSCSLVLRETQHNSQEEPRTQFKLPASSCMSARVGGEIRRNPETTFAWCELCACVCKLQCECLQV